LHGFRSAGARFQGGGCDGTACAHADSHSVDAQKVCTTNDCAEVARVEHVVDEEDDGPTPREGKWE